MRTVELGDIALINSDCLDVMRGMPENSVDTCITDPPYELGFMGSGTTLVACERLGRKAIGIDNDEAYFDIAVKRVQREQQQMRLF